MKITADTPLKQSTKQFWLDAWKNRQIRFHQSAPNPNLIKYFEHLQLQRGDQIFVPFCGKSLDLLWLLEQNLKVLGVEISKQAVDEFYQENLMASKDPTLEMMVGDLFELSKEKLKNIRAVYDRAAYVALPLELRKEYASFMGEYLPTDVRYLLLNRNAPAQACDQGPPYSVSEEELQKNFGEHFQIKKLDSSTFSASDDPYQLGGFREVYLLKK